MKAKDLAAVLLQAPDAEILIRQEDGSYVPCNRAVVSTDKDRVLLSFEPELSR